MAREEYQVPTSGGQAASGGGNYAGGSIEPVRAKMSYLCGDCGVSVSLGKDATVQCPHCAGRVLYKERTKR